MPSTGERKEPFPMPPRRTIGGKMLLIRSACWMLGSLFWIALTFTRVQSQRALHKPVDTLTIVVIGFWTLAFFFWAYIGWRGYKTRNHTREII